MRRYRFLSLVVVGVMAAALLAGASASAFRAHAAKTTVLKYFFKTTSQSFTSPSGKPVSNTNPPAVGDTLFATVNAYAGNAKHHAANWTGSAFLYCTVTKVVNPSSNVQATCDGVVAIGGSMVTSISTQNLASTVPGEVYPIAAGTGKYLKATGTIKTTNVGSSGSSNAVITIKT
jgi:type II secretory pathway pseudopilin PulG